MIATTIAWLLLPFIGSLLVYWLPMMYRVMALLPCLVSVTYSAEIFLLPAPWHVILLDHFGVSIMVDQLSAFFILTNALVTLAVVLYSWTIIKSTFYFTQLMILHGSLNALFISSDFISVYVALELISIAAFLLIVHPRTDRAIWVGLRYLFVSNVAMLFYLIGTILVYQATHTFSFNGLAQASNEAKTLIFFGLLVKGGIFVSGLWLPFTHSESESPVSALLSGIVVKAGVFPIVRCALLFEEMDSIVRIFGVASTLFGVLFAMLEKDSKRLLAFSTISQLGFILAAPIVAGFYTLTHGLVKAALFLIAGVLPSRDLIYLRRHPIPIGIWTVLLLASSSISGLPFLSGFSAKVLTAQNLLSWQVIAMNLATLGTAIAFARFIFIPCSRSSNTGSHPESLKTGTGFRLAMLLLLGGLALANIFYYQAYTQENSIKAVLTVGVGWLSYGLVFRRINFKLPVLIEEFEQQIGLMSLVLVFLFWFVWL